MKPMRRMGRPTSSLALAVLVAAVSFVTAFGGLAAAQDTPAVEEGTVKTRVVTIGSIEGETCPAGAPGPCWDTTKIVGRPGETISIVADLTTSSVTHNLAVRDGTANDAKPLADVAYSPVNRNGDGTQQAANLVHIANFTLPADFNGELGFICQVHATSMKGKIVTPEAFAAAGGGGEPVHHLGVHFLAYWVGLIAFAILFLVYGITFFLFKYNETTATTDHWDRTGAGAPETKSKMSGGTATLLAIVIGIAALAGIVYLARMG